jgi:hypothetical protein
MYPIGRDITLISAAFVGAFALSTQAQVLDLDPKSPTSFEWTCLAALSANPRDAFERLAANLVKAPYADEADAAARLVLALTLRKIPADVEYMALPPERRSAIAQGLESLDGVSVERTVDALATLLASETCDSTAWFISPRQWAGLAGVTDQLQAISSDAADAARQIDVMNQAGAFDFGDMIMGADVDAIKALLNSPGAALSERTRERVRECLATAVIEARAGSASRLVMLCEIAACGPNIRSLKGLSATQTARAFETLLKESPDADPEKTIERLVRLRQLLDHAKLVMPTAEQLNLAKPLKPAHVQLTPVFRQMQRPIAPIAKKLLDTAESLNDPAIMSVDRSFLGVLQDLKTLARISERITVTDQRGRIVIRDDCTFAATRLLDAVKRVARAKDDEKEDRLNEWRELCAMIELALYAPDVESVRSDRSLNASNALVRFESAQREYLRSLADSRKSPDEDIVRSIQAGAGLFRFRARTLMEDPTLALAWPGVEISTAGMTVLRAEIPSHVNELMEQYAAGRFDRVAVQLREGESRFAAALAIADLARALESTGIAPASALDEVTSRDPDPFVVIGVKHIEAFRFISLCAEEIATLSSNGKDAAEVVNRMNARARSVRLDPTP